MYVIVMQEGEQKEKREDEMFEEITAKNFKLKKNIKTTDPRNSENTQQAYIHTHTQTHHIHC